MRIAQISDLHFVKATFNPLRLCSKRFIGVANWLIHRKNTLDKDLLTPLPQIFNDLKVDLILVGGDLTTTSLPSEFEMAHYFLSTIPQPKIFIPGNHDQYTAGAHRSKRFYRSFANPRKEISHPVEFFTLAEHRVEAHRLGNWGWCVALDTAPPTSFSTSNGLFSKALEAHLKEVLQLLEGERILMLNHFPFFQNDLPRHRLINGNALRAVVEKNPNIHLYLHGHTHRHSIADLQPSGLPLILDSGCPVQKNGTWNLIDLKDEGCVVQPWRFDETAWVGADSLSFAWRKS